MRPISDVRHSFDTDLSAVSVRRPVSRASRPKQAIGSSSLPGRGASWPFYNLQVTRDAQQSFSLMGIHLIKLMPFVGQNIDIAACEHAV